MINKDDIKTFLGLDLQDDDYDNEIEALIQDSESMLSSILGVDTFNHQERTVWLPYSEETKTATSSFYPITSIMEVGGSEYTWTINTDFIIEGRDIIFISDIYPNIVNGKILMKYTTWYPVPWEGEEYPPTANQIRLAIKFLASGLWNTKKEIGVTQAKIGMETYSFRSITDSEDFMRIVKNIKNQYGLSGSLIIL